MLCVKLTFIKITFYIIFLIWIIFYLIFSTLAQLSIVLKILRQGKLPKVMNLHLPCNFHKDALRSFIDFYLSVSIFLFKIYNFLK